MMSLIGAVSGRITGWITGRELGQGMLEYALILGLIVVAIIGAFTFFDLGGLISGIFADVESAIS